MSNYLLGISGFLSILVAWGFVILPPFIYGFDPKKDTISKITTKNHKVKKFVSLGLVCGALFQITFAVLLAYRFSSNWYNIGIFMYISCSLITILVAIFNEKDYLFVHRVLVYLYFFMIPISIFYLGTRVIPDQPFITLVSVVFLILYFCGHLLLVMKHRKANAISEIYSFALITIWTLIVIFTK